MLPAFFIVGLSRAPAQLYVHVMSCISLDTELSQKSYAAGLCVAFVTVAMPFTSHCVHDCAGIAWAVWFEHIQSGIEAKEPEVAAKLQGYQQHSGSVAKLDASGKQTVPWRGFLRNRPVQALAYTHFCNNWYFADPP